MSDPITQATSSSLLHYFVRDVSRTLKKNVSGVSPRTMAELTAYHWPGNVRELKNVIESGVIMSNGPELELQNWWTPPASADPGGSDHTLESIERQHILDVLERCD